MFNRGQVVSKYGITRLIHRRRKRGGGGGGGGHGGIFLQFLCETGKNHKYTKLKGKIINVTLI